jgi:hypothetical protein
MSGFFMLIYNLKFIISCNLREGSQRQPAAQRGLQRRA